MDPNVEKAAVLMEALPYLRDLYGRRVVIKYGGAAMGEASLQEGFAREIVLLHLVGAAPVVVHGGGPEITRMLNALGIESRFHDGQRITDPATMEVVDMVLGGKINNLVVQSIVQAGGPAVGLSGRSARLIEAQKLHLPDRGGGLGVDMGLVGEIRQVNTAILESLLRDRFIPVIAPVGLGDDGRSYNINADLMASAVAGALRAEKLILMTDVPGVLDAQKRLRSTLTPAETEQGIADGTIHGGMIPKVRYALAALAQGVPKAHIIDGRARHALLLELFTQAGIGTEIVRG